MIANDNNRLIRSVASILLITFIFSGLLGCGRETTVSDTTLSDEEFFNLYKKVDTNNSIMPQVEMDYSGIDKYLNNELVDEESKEQLRVARYVYRYLNYLVAIEIEVSGNSLQSPTISINTVFHYGGVKVDEYYNDTKQHEGAYFDSFELDILYKNMYLWLNDKVPYCYDFFELGDYICPFVDFLNTHPTIEEIELYLDDNDCQWFKTLNDYWVSEDSVSDSRSKDNPYIFLVLVDNYAQYNPKLETTVAFSSFFYYREFMKELVIIYKKYGEAVWGQEINGEYVIEDYDKMFGPLDRKIMDEFDLAPEDFR